MLPHISDVLSANFQTKFPDVQGVSVGAILSNYQRVRVEHVCQRLSLTPLCYLWQRDQAELLTEMIDSGLEAIIIKVAGIGLATKHLGKTLAEIQPTLVKLVSVIPSVRILIFEICRTACMAHTFVVKEASTNR